METLIGLLAVTGMRIGEVVQLDVTDIDWPEGLLTVRSGKFGKSREAPRSTGANDLVPVEVDSRSRNTSCPWSLRA